VTAQNGEESEVAGSSLQGSFPSLQRQEMGKKGRKSCLTNLMMKIMLDQPDSFLRRHDWLGR